MPEERLAARRVLTLEQRHETHAVAMLPGLRREARELQQCRIKIRADDRRIARGAGFRDAGRADDQRLAHAALVGPALARAQREVRGGMTLARRETAVVRHEDDDGFFGETVFLERRQHAADAGVELLEHRGIDGVVLHEAHFAFAFLTPRVRWRAFLFLQIFRDEFGSRADGRVNGQERQIREERPVLVLADELHRLVHDALGGLRIVAVIGHGQVGFRIPELLDALRAIAVGQLLGKTLRAGIKLAAAEMPLAREERRVAAVIAQRLGDRDLRERQVQRVRRGLQFFRAHSRNEIRDAEPRRILARHDAAARRRAHAARRVALREAHPAPGERVDVGRLVKCFRIERADVHVAEIVGEDEHDVGLGRACVGGGDEARGEHEREQQEAETFHIKSKVEPRMDTDKSGKCTR